MEREQILVFVDRHPVVVDQTTGCSNRKACLYLRCYLFKSEYPIQLAINPHPSTRTGGDACSHLVLPISTRPRRRGPGSDDRNRDRVPDRSTTTKLPRRTPPTAVSAAIS